MFESKDAARLVVQRSADDDRAIVLHSDEAPVERGV
jgi:hypothetical protein